MLTRHTTYAQKTSLAYCDMLHFLQAFADTKALSVSGKLIMKYEDGLSDLLVAAAILYFPCCDMIVCAASSP